MKEVPKIGQTYNCFDDGQINHNSLYTVDVKEVIEFCNIDKETRNNWKKQVDKYSWLYSKETDFFIKTKNVEYGNPVFVRINDGGWFSLGVFMNSGILDVDGKLTEILKAH